MSSPVCRAPLAARSSRGGQRLARPAALIVVAVASMTVGARAGLAQTPAPTGTRLTLAQAEAQALKTNPSILAARLQRPVDEANVGVAAERPNPDVAFGVTRETPREILTVSVPIELGGKRGRRVDLAHATVAAGDAERDETIAEIQNDVRRAYFQLVAADAKVKLAQDAQTLAQRTRDAAQARFSAGEVPQSDVTQAELGLADAEDDTTDAQGDAKAARADLNSLLGWPAMTPVSATDPLDARPVPTLEEALEQSARVNSELAALDRHIDEQVARVNVAKSMRTPDFTAGGGVGFNAQPDFSAGWNLSFDMTVPLFTTHQSGVTVETATLSRMRAEREARALTIAGDVQAAYAHLEAAQARLQQFQRRSLPLSVQVEQMAQAAYAAGEKGLTDLLQALQQVRDIRAKALDSSLDFQLALADLEHAIGAPIR
jgi:cobalt-zinc-cadmium efflux system outer membrane protein